jgi:ATP adenylyltransferase
MKSKAKNTKNTKKNSEATFKDLDQNIWPMERDVFFRPARLKYVRKLIKPDGCVFCSDTKAKENNSLCVFQTKYSQIVLNKFPYNSGHLLVLPLRHCGNLLALSKVEYADLMQTLKFAIQAVTDIYCPQGYNLGLNNGAASGAGIPNHLHFHIVPRWNGDLNFFPLIAETKLVIEEVKVSFKKYKKYFDKNKKKMEVA